ncbi:peptidoglycan-binding protein [Aerosakkonemataceae cyanobacterium BLCC-F154]|uniref:Peptidoglycan-binding protein n=1 Tax=Floridaenema fluviatile BLCC-F154 TaxID=3153640 RepID=A0ABV4YIZ6_9CYAN
MQAQCECSLPTLRKGSKGDDVKLLQAILNSYGYSLKVDGVFGQLTEDAVKRFQKSRGLKVDGIVGPKTWNALLSDLYGDLISYFPILRRGSKGYCVTELQKSLNLFLTDALVIDGIFGSITEAAVRDLQRTYGLVVDGIVGPETWNAIFSMSN